LEFPDRDLPSSISVRPALPHPSTRVLTVRAVRARNRVLHGHSHLDAADYHVTYLSV
jgi:hypothetical protein